ncbi:MAG: GDP-mannose 4,6-dehydratase [Gammaproteobacteria bacterium]|nr:MAG: GDP-mannose 4,6-dehydratase [Gammaproteobacteria bacterium]
MKQKTALITGITGQDGSYLAELLLSKGYRVYGMIRHSASRDLTTGRISHLLKDIEIVDADLTDQNSLTRLIRAIQPDEVYNLAAQSFVKLSFDQPEMTCDTTGMGVLRMLEAIRSVNPTGIKFYQASSSEMFGKVLETPQTETTRFNPRSPYGVAKAFGHFMTVNYRDSYGMFAVSGILFNHESPRRGLEFVTRKVTDGAAKIKLGLETELRLGNLDARRDWGYAPDFCEAMYLMLQQDKPQNYVISTGEMHSIKDLCKIAFSHVGLDWEDYVKVDRKFLRPAEVDLLLGDSDKAKSDLGWAPKTSFEEMIRKMVDSDLERLKKL